MSLSQNKSYYPLSQFALGMWRLGDWNLPNQELLTYIKQAIDLGVTTMDHADIYGNYECEEIFARAISLDPSIRHKMQLVTKCGIKLRSDKFPNRKVKYYDYSKKYIINQVETSLKNLKTDYIDALLLHRPSPFFDHAEVAETFSQLKKDGKVKYFGVSNFTLNQFKSLQEHCEEPLITNQIEISPYALEHFENENIDYLTSAGIRPMAWSPLAGGSLLHPETDKGKRVLNAIQEVSTELGNIPFDQVIFAWILAHPSQIIPVIGTGKYERLQSAVESKNVKLSLEQWFKIYVASLGDDVP